MKNFSLIIALFTAAAAACAGNPAQDNDNNQKIRQFEEQKQLDEKQKQLDEKLKLLEQKAAENEQHQREQLKKLESEKKNLADQRLQINAERKRIDDERKRLESEKARLRKEKQLLADQRTIRELIFTHRSAVLSADLTKMLSICSKDYCEISYDGKKRSYDDLLKMVKYFSLMRNSNDIEVVMENALLIQGLTISDQLREKASSIKNTSQAQQTVNEIRNAFDRITAKSSEAVKFITVRDIVIKDGQASAISEINDPASDKKYPVKYQLILHRNQWLIRSAF
ncbi:MAG: hypothetical protein E7058_03730 [Lentisphaerae bacterium]|nr:hypothetical protein [Lentisphaerota bacterium]